MSTSSSLPLTADTLSLESLPNDPLALKGLIVELVQALREEQQQHLKVQERLDQLLRRLYGRHSERLDPQQLLLFADSGPEQPPPPTVAGEAGAAAGAPRRRPAGHGRQRLPEHVRREEVRHELTEAERRCPCCGEIRAVLGEDISEQMDYIPASLVVKRHVRVTYVCRACERRRQQGTPASLTPVVGAEPLSQPLLAPAPVVSTLPQVDAAKVPQETLRAQAVAGVPAVSVATPEAVLATAAPANSEVVVPTVKTEIHNPEKVPEAPVGQGEVVAVAPVETEPPPPDDGAGSVRVATTAADAAVDQGPATPQAEGQNPDRASPAVGAGGAVVAGSTIVTAALPAQPWPRCLAGPGLLAYLIVSKFMDHLPLYRLERILWREGVWLSRRTLCDWLAGCARVLRPLYDLMWQRVFQSRWLHTDDTPVRVQEQTTQGRFWIYVGDSSHRYTVFDFTLGRSQDRPLECLKDFRGFLQADAYSGYDKVFAAGCVEVGCWAHARRYFYEARDYDPVRACYVLGLIGHLYGWEAAARYAAEVREMGEDGFWDVREQLRQRQALPLLAQLGQYLERERDQVLPASKMGEAFTYLHNQWAALQVYVAHGFLEIDNNIGEQGLRGIGIGRKNWLFVGSVEGGTTAAILYSMTETCKWHGIDAWVYLREMLTVLPSLSESEWPTELPKLLPDVWAAARRQEAASRGPPEGGGRVPR